MSFRTKASCLRCSGSYDPTTVVYWDIDDLERGYIKFKCDICGKENTVTLSQCHIIDTDDYQRTVEMYLENKNALDRLKKERENQCKTHTMKPRKWWRK